MKKDDVKFVNDELKNAGAEDVLSWAKEYAEKDVEDCHNIGKAGVQLIEEIYHNKKDTVNILTHCNAGWLATGEYGTATAPIYLAHDADIPVHVWVDETRPRNQGANLTAWELKQHGVPFTIIADIVPQERLNEGIGMFGVTGLIGVAVGPAISEPIIRHFGYDAYFLTISGIAVCLLLLLIPLPETLV